MSNEETIDELKRQIRAYEATVHNLNLQLEAAGASGAVAPDDRVPEAWTNLLAYVLQDDMHNRLTPRVIDIAYTAFMQAKKANDEDGGASDWFNDTRPMVRGLIEQLKKDLIKELAAAHPTPTAQAAPAATPTTAPQQEVQEPFAWACWVDDEDKEPKHAQFSPVEPLAYGNRKALYTAPQPAPSIGAEGLSADTTLLDVCTDPNNCKRCNTHPHHRDGLAHAGIPAAALAAQKGGAA